MSIPVGTTAWNPQTGHQIVMTPNGWQEAGSPQAQARPADQDAMKADIEAAQQAQWLAQKGNQFGQTQDQGPGNVTGTGPQFKEIGIPHVAENINPLPGIAAAVNPRIAGMESISNQAWTHMRPTGSGPMRMPEIEGFQQAFPSIEHTPQANAAIEQRLTQDAQYAAQKLQFIDTFMRGNRGSYADANAAWQASQQGNIQTSQLPPPGGAQQQSQFAPQPTQGHGYGGPVPGAQPMAGAPPPQPSQALPPAQQQAPAQGGWQIVGVQ